MKSKKNSIFLLFFFILNSNLFSQYLKINDSSKRILKVLGEPDTIKNGPTFQSWLYNEEILFVYQDQLKGYTDSASLGIKMTSVNRPGKKQDWIDLNSTDNDLLRILGTPTRLIKGNIYDYWWYGDEYFTLVKSHIIAFTDAKKLGVTFKTKSKKIPKRLNETSTVDDVIALKGTPDKVQRGISNDAWWYGNDFILVEKDKLIFVDYKAKNKRNQKSVSPWFF